MIERSKYSVVAIFIYFWRNPKRDFKETKKLSKFESELQNIEDNLPLETKYKNPKLGTESPIVVVNEIFAGGDVGRFYKMNIITI